MNPKPQNCLRDPIPEIAEAASYLQEAVTAHLAGKHAIAAGLITRTNTSEIREWTESLWGAKSPYVNVREILEAPPKLSKDQRIKVRMPTTAEKNMLHERDGLHCRFCSVPLIRMEIRKRIREVYREALPWGSTNPTQHAAFQAMWLQYDHLLPHERGGDNSLENLLITCAPCNYARMNYTFEEVGLIDPRSREVIRSSWDGLERFR